MSVQRESAQQLVRERFHLSSDEQLYPFSMAERRVDHVRSLSVTVPLTEGNTTDIVFTQSAQFTSASRTSALLFPPLGRFNVLPVNVGVRFHSHEHSVGKSSLSVIDEPVTFSGIYDRLWCSVLSTTTGSELAQGYVMEKNGKTITIGGYNATRSVFAWPSKTIALFYNQPPIEYGIAAGGAYTLVQTERPMDTHEDIDLVYSLENVLRAEMQYNITLLAGTNVCTFDTTYTVRNLTLDTTFDRITSLRIVDSTQRSSIVERSAPAPVYEASMLRYSKMTSSSSSSSPSSIQSLVRPVDFVYDQSISIGPMQTVELFNGEPALLSCLLSYESEELQPYMASSAKTSALLWFRVKELAPLITRSAQTKVAITRTDTRTTMSSFYWNRDEDDAKYVFSGKEWLPKVLYSAVDATQIRIENDGVEESSTGKLLRFHATSFLHENSVLAFPVFPNQVEGRCLSVECIDDDDATLKDQPWSDSALPQLYAIFSLGAEKRLNFIARFSIGSK